MLENAENISIPHSAVSIPQTMMKLMNSRIKQGPFLRQNVMNYFFDLFWKVYPSSRKKMFFAVRAVRKQTLKISVLDQCRQHGQRLQSYSFSQSLILIRREPLDP